MDEDTKIIAGILEDDKKESLILENTLQTLADECSIKIDIVFACTTWKQFMTNANNSAINACFLDIDLNDPSINGMKVAEKIDSMEKDIKIIFVTGHNGYMNTAFKVSAFDYLIKPLNSEDLRQTLVRLSRKISSSTKCLEIKAQEYIRVPYKDIVYILYEDRRVKVITTDSVEILPSTFNLKSIIDKLPADKFVECNPYTCINMDYVKKLNGVEIELNLSGLPVIKNEYAHLNGKMYASRTGVKRVKDFINDIVRM